MAFSPDGSALAYQIGPGAVRRRDFSSVIEEVVSLSLNPGDALGAMFWDSTALWAVVDRLNGGVRARNTETGAEVVIAPFEFGKRVRLVTWAPGGRRLALWEEFCVAAPSGTPCQVETATLFLVDRDTGARTEVARGAAPGGPVAIAPDGTGIVYGFGGELYRASLP